MQGLLVVLFGSLMLAQAGTVPARWTDVKMDGLKAGPRTVSTAIERPSGAKEQVDESTFDGEGRLVKRIVYRAGVVLYTSTFEHPEGGVRVEVRRYADRPPLSRLEPKNGRVPPRYFDESGAELFCRTIDFDAGGRPLAEFTYAGREPRKGPPAARVVYQYTAGRPSAATYFERFPEQQVRREVFVYDRQRVWTETIVYDPVFPSPEKRTWTDTLDPLGNWIRREDVRTRAGQEVRLVYVRTIGY
ncbi:MAG: hypothetical protein IT175_15505 [Acidobacteria bacterium]|nr:hypothetical protein [Acidobacteriota bacterium]